MNTVTSSATAMGRADTLSVASRTARNISCKGQTDAERQQNNVQFRAELGAVDDQQNAAAGQQRKRRQFAKGGKNWPSELS